MFYEQGFYYFCPDSDNWDDSFYINNLSCSEIIIKNIIQ